MLAQLLKKLAATAALLVTVTVGAAAQTFPTIPPNTVIGRLGINPGPAQAIPNSQLFSLNLFDQIGTAPGVMPCRGASVWGPISPGAAGNVLMSTGTTTCPAFSVPVPVTSGGTGGLTAALARAAVYSVSSLPPGNAVHACRHTIGSPVSSLPWIRSCIGPVANGRRNSKTLAV